MRLHSFTLRVFFFCTMLVVASAQARSYELTDFPGWTLISPPTRAQQICAWFVSMIPGAGPVREPEKFLKYFEPEAVSLRANRALVIRGMFRDRTKTSERAYEIHRLIRILETEWPSVLISYVDMPAKVPVRVYRWATKLSSTEQHLYKKAELLHHSARLLADRIRDSENENAITPSEAAALLSELDHAVHQWRTIAVRLRFPDDGPSVEWREEVVVDFPFAIVVEGLIPGETPK
ncbi:hypothetical protein K2X33_02200 [bacterium]|nr:hypothetical protein [bacterium]